MPCRPRTENWIRHVNSLPAWPPVKTRITPSLPKPRIRKINPGPGEIFKTPLIVVADCARENGLFSTTSGFSSITFDTGAQRQAEWKTALFLTQCGTRNRNLTKEAERSHPPKA